jgi:hypothetical protein
MTSVGVQPAIFYSFWVSIGISDVAVLCFGLLWLLVGGLTLDCVERDCWTARSDDTGRRTSRVRIYVQRERG